MDYTKLLLARDLSRISLDNILQKTLNGVRAVASKYLP